MHLPEVAFPTRTSLSLMWLYSAYVECVARLRLKSLIDISHTLGKKHIYVILRCDITSQLKSTKVASLETRNPSRP